VAQRQYSMPTNNHALRFLPSIRVVLGAASLHVSVHTPNTLGPLGTYPFSFPDGSHFHFHQELEEQVDIS
ncbi:MAG TPA: hypothetical protein VIH54_16340, partial [Chthoniobacterales bacterium]